MTQYHSETSISIFGSMDLIDNFPPGMTFSDEKIAIPLKCWQDISLSSIWIPSRLLGKRKEPSNPQASKGIFHTLQRRDPSKCINGFSVYSDGDIFLSDSDEDIPDSYENENLTETTGNNLPVNADFRRGVSGMKSMPSINNLCAAGSDTDSKVGNSLQKWNIRNAENDENVTKEKEKTDSYIPLNEILDTTPEVTIIDSRRLNNRLIEANEKTSDSSKKKNKKKKKAPKHVPLDEFLEGYEEADYQNDCCNDYFRKVLREKEERENAHSRNTADFPDLTCKELEFIHSDKTEEKDNKPPIRTIAEALSNSIKKNENVLEVEAAPQTKILNSLPELDKDIDTDAELSNIGRLIIENIPKSINKDDVYSFLCGYGEIKTFSLESDEEFHTAYIEIDLTCDIDWVIDCLNDTEPFGASSKPLKCYRQQ